MERKGIWFSLLTSMGEVILRLVGSTLRYSVREEESLDALRKAKGSIIYAVWHGKMLGPILTKRTKRISVLISEHRDGDYIARIVNSLGFDPVRGSTTRGGSRALKEMVREGLRGRDLAVTPDGPRGPIYRAKMGVVKLAQLTRMPIVPIGFSSSRAFVFRSWDKFVLPLPFSRCVLLLGSPFWVNSDSEIEKVRAELERSLTRLTEEAERLC